MTDEGTTFVMEEKKGKRLFLLNQHGENKLVGTYYPSEKLFDKEIKKPEHFVRKYNGFAIAKYVVDRLKKFTEPENIDVRVRIKTDIETRNGEINNGDILKVSLEEFIKGHKDNPFRLNDRFEPQFFCPITHMRQERKIKADVEDKKTTFEDKSLADFV